MPPKKRPRSRRIQQEFCPHCNANVSVETYRKHQRLHFNPVTGTWGEEADAENPSLVNPGSNLAGSRRGDRSHGRTVHISSYLDLSRCRPEDVRSARSARSRRGPCRSRGQGPAARRSACSGSGFEESAHRICAQILPSAATLGGDFPCFVAVARYASTPALPLCCLLLACVLTCRIPL